MALPKAPLQKLPRGLLGFMDLKNGGKFPQTLGSDTLECNADLIQWYLETNAEELGLVTNAIAAPGTTFLATVPNEEFWYVSQFSGLVTAIAAGETPLIVPVVLYPQATAVLVIGTPAVGGGAAANDGAVFSQNAFFIPPGAQLGIRISGTFVSVDLQQIARFARLPI